VLTLFKEGSSVLLTGSVPQQGLVLSMGSFNRYHPCNLQGCILHWLPAGTVPVCGTHIIQQGDTLSDLSITLSLSLADIVAVNPGVVPDSLQIGDMINLPCKAGDRSPQPQPVPEASGK
jgi:hypothetical protein